MLPMQNPKYNKSQSLSFIVVKLSNGYVVYLCVAMDQGRVPGAAIGVQLPDDSGQVLDVEVARTVGTAKAVLRGVCANPRRKLALKGVAAMRASLPVSHCALGHQEL
jgi:hypothetical protein